MSRNYIFGTNNETSGSNSGGFFVHIGSAESYDSIRKWEYYVMLIKLFILFLYHTIYLSECWPQFMFKSKI